MRTWLTISATALTVSLMPAGVHAGLSPTTPQSVVAAQKQAETSPSREALIAIPDGSRARGLTQA
jgi:hypothetical protein